MNVFIVIPTIRTLRFLRSWGNEFQDCTLLIVEDHPEQQIATPTGNYKKVIHTTWKDIKKDFGRDEWIFSRQNAGIRSYGFWKAYALGADVIITLDDDCFPVDREFVGAHIDNLRQKAPISWTTTYPHGDFLYTRGIPYSVRNIYPAIVSHGLWTNKIDLDAKTEIKTPDINLPAYPSVRQFVPKGVYFPMCSMNLAFRREATPLMYFPLMGKDPEGKPWGYDRFDDIWAGIFTKKIIDHLGFSVVNGSPFIEHRKASDPATNLKKERRGLQTNEQLWKLVDRVKLTKKTPATCYKELAEKTSFPTGQYFVQLKRAMLIWSGYF